MEIIIVLVIMVIVSVLVFTQLKGTKPPIVSVLEHNTVSRTKKSPKKTEPKRNVEKWDEPEPVKASDSPTRSKKDRKKIFDPVAEGAKVVKSATVATRDTTVRRRTEDVDLVKQAEEERKAKKNLAADGFVIVEEKKKVARKEEEGEEPKAAPEKSENDLIIERLRAIREGAYKGNSNNDERREENKPKSVLNAKPVSYDEVAKKLADHKALSKKTTTPNLGGRILQGAPVEAKAAPWASKTFSKPEPEAEAEAEPVADEGAEDAVEDTPAVEEED
eukprot:TRINITY_DN72862_c0_g1_i1.p1 TRINITY_DN72862_c0_g1~~TRINITY_DN72862_c0_g1_i1.p1  ORF type:complete len:292 (+),score=152.97 TRINITY_DN72862_c0_g1_i1:50-877(+)